MQAHRVQPEVKKASRLMSKLTALTCGLLAWALVVPAQAFYTPGQFGVSPTGAANYTIPIAVPPGTAGMVPSLSINYNSQGGNGLLGIGWSLSGLSAITRCPKTKLQDGIADLREPIKYDATDKYCLDGQRLALYSGVYGENGAEYRTERESFSRIISYGSSGSSSASPVTGVGYFKVWTKAGLIMEYGSTADSLIEQQGKSSVQVWALSKVTDTLGNYYKITYQNNGNANGEFYPTRIDYTGNAKVLPELTPYNSVRFVYEARPDSPVLYDNSGSKIQSQQRLAKIQTYAHEGSADTLVKEYKLDYEVGPATRRSRITKITECDGSGTPAGCLPSTVIGWDLAGDAIGNAVYTQVNSAAGWDTIPYRYAGDINGDGKTDMLVQHYAYATSGYKCTGLVFPAAFSCTPVTLPAGTAGAGTMADFNSDGYDDYLGNNQLCWGPSLTTCVTAQISAPKAIYVGNVNGDQYPDVIFYRATLLNGPGAHFKFSRGYCLGPNLNECHESVSNFEYVAYPIPSGLPPSVSDVIPGDFNADGKTDLIYTMAYGPGTYLCSGEAIAQDNAACMLMNNDSWSAYYKPHSSDFNGDGISDLFLVSDSGSYFCPGPVLAPGFTTANNCTLVTGDTAGWKTTYSVLPGDYNGDGVSDLYLVGAAKSLFCAGPGITTTADNCAVKHTGDWKTGNDIRPGDYDGDGATDLLLISDTNRAFVKAGAGHADRVTGITNGLGAVTSIAYRALTDDTSINFVLSVYTKGTGANVKGAGYLELQAPMYVVSDVGSSNGVGGMVWSSYYYWRARAHLEGGGFMGFELVRSCDTSVSPNICTQTQYIQDYPYQGLPKQVLKFAMNGTTANHLNVVTNTWSYLTADAAHSSLGPIYNVPQLTKSQEVSRELAGGGTQLGAVVTNVTTTNTYDDYGNPEVITISSVDSSVTPSIVYKKTTSNTYDNLDGLDPDGNIRWLLGRLLTAKVTSTTP